MRSIKFTTAAFLMLMGTTVCAVAQDTKVWNNKQCAVVLTYDDAIDIDIDNVAPALDSLNLKGTFYLIGSSPVIDKRMAEWKKIAANGHELGNHALFHPCDGSKPGRSFVNPEHDLAKYSVARTVDEVRINNTLLKAIDGKDSRTFAYPCGDLTVNGVFFYKELEKDFAGARGVTGGMKAAGDVNLSDINSYMISNQTGDELIELVKKAQQSHTLIVFLFHGVGGGHSINVSLAAHSKLLHYLKNNEKDIWVAPMVDVAEQVAAYQKGKK
ncbi:polysaccharide deacetylase family protein [Mucilaginibacter auburnensis]|uniref:Polysaccharide deacetylase n=1 Tax=Mucilaginibacter auburnensis TaxID=1457233 RepID=A0A2H9VNZ5_9SPHI|nr:polysaccharide deacetylase family protein [Mucilaginibacter auburnensis]PJJ80046.1 polysaccharide deacetylase [Mucilaginibacter auburnensis]